MADIEIYEKAKGVVASAPALFTNHETRLATVGNAINSWMAKANSEFTQDVYNEGIELVAKIGKTKSTFNSERIEFTRILDEIGKSFTSQENKLDVKNSNSEVYKVQQKLNDFARIEAEKKKERERIAQQKANRDMDISKCEATAKAHLSRAVNDFVVSEKKLMLAKINGITKKTAESINEEFSKYTPNASGIVVPRFTYPSAYISAEESAAIFNNVIISDFYKELISSSDADLSMYAEELFDTIPSVINALSSPATKKAAERELIKAEIALEQETASRTDAINTNENIEQSAAEAQSQMSFTAEMAAPSISFKEKVTIKIISWPQALPLIISLWMREEFPTLDEKKILSYSVDRMIAFCVRIANKENIRINNPSIEYVPDITAK